MGMNVGKSFERDSWEEVHFHGGGSLACHNRKPPSTVPDAGDAMSIITYAFWPVSCADTCQWKQARRLYLNIALFPSSSLCDCRRCYFQPCLINMCHIRCEKYSQGPFMPFDTLAIIQRNCHHFLWAIFQKSSNFIESSTVIHYNRYRFKYSLQSYNWRPFHTKHEAKKQDDSDMN